MTTEIQVPTLGESVTEATVAQWFKKEGEAVNADEPLCELETDKVTVEVPAPSAGVLSEIRVGDGETVEVGAIIGAITEGAVAAAPPKTAKSASAVETKPESPPRSPATEVAQEAPVMPAAARIIEQNQLDVSKLSGTGKAGRVTKGDALAALEAKTKTPASVPVNSGPRPESAREERAPMTRLRRTIAARLKGAQNTAAMLTTFNEVDMAPVMELRKQYKDDFASKHGVKLGFMSFFVKSCIAALKDIPSVNAEIEGDDIIYKNYYDIGVAVGTEKGLVVPVLREADQKSLADIEKDINDFGERARDGALKLEELQGGTFTISNGGVYGSLMSTPILNSPQSGILGMHKIQQRPMAVDGEVVVRPMMYLALSYDHRLVDGREAVTFLVRVKESLEGPERLLLGL
jgi:2-oxoglutarate dehydrogenase E2 component (dihydrolipoamide succinyltransferase)